MSTQISITDHLESEILKGNKALEQLRSYVRDHNSDNLLVCLAHDLQFAPAGAFDDNLYGLRPAMLEVAARECLSGDMNTIKDSRCKKEAQRLQFTRM